MRRCPPADRSRPGSQPPRPGRRDCRARGGGGAGGLHPGRDGARRRRHGRRRGRRGAAGGKPSSPMLACASRSTASGWRPIRSCSSTSRPRRSTAGCWSAARSSGRRTGSRRFGWSGACRASARWSTKIRVSRSEGLPGFARDAWISTQLRSRITLDRRIRAINYTVDTVAGNGLFDGNCARRGGGRAGHRPCPADTLCPPRRRLYPAPHRGRRRRLTAAPPLRRPSPAGRGRPGSRTETRRTSLMAARPDPRRHPRRCSERRPRRGRPNRNRDWRRPRCALGARSRTRRGVGLVPAASRPLVDAAWPRRRVRWDSGRPPSGVRRPRPLSGRAWPHRLRLWSVRTYAATRICRTPQPRCR